MNQEKHWDGIAQQYEDEIFDVFKSDKDKILPFFFKKHSHPSHDAIDFGCGIGKAFQYLAPHFKTVLAIDISSNCIKLARQNTYSNIFYKRLDLSRPGLTIPKADFAFCCNVIMLPEIKRNELMLKNIRQSLKSGGHALIVIPSLESIFFSSWRLIDWYRKEGVKPEDIPAGELNYFRGTKRDILQGLVYINGVPTKHYLQPEIEVLFDAAGFRITALEKLEYDWNTEFAEPPDWMKKPYPWDWLIECTPS